MNPVAVTARSFRQVPGEHHELLRAAGLPVRFPEADRPLDEQELVELVRGCWGLIVGVDPVTAAALDAGPLQVVVRLGSGTDNVDLEAAARRGVRVATTPAANARSVAELAIGLLLALARHLVLHDREVRSGSWARRTGIELAGRRLGVVGHGAVGRQVAGIARTLGMEVVATDPMVREADVPLVDERALAEALAAGRIGGAAFDTFEREPPQGSPLLALDNFVASPMRAARPWRPSPGPGSPRSASCSPGAGPVAERSGHEGDHVHR